MKLLIISPAHLHGFKIGGPIASMESMNKGLVNEGVFVDVLATPYGLEDESTEILNVWQEVDNIKNYKVKYFKYFGYGNFTFSPSLVIETFKIIKEYDIVICNGIMNFPLILSALIALIKNKPYTFIPHGTLYKETFELKSKFVKKIFYNLLVRHLLIKCSGVHFTTLDEKDKVCNYLNINPKSYIVPNSIDVSKYSKLPQRGVFLQEYPYLKNKRLIVFYGRITAKKGMDILIQSFYKLSMEFPDLHLIIAGSDEENYSLKVKKWILNYELSEKVTFTGLLTGVNKYSVLIDSEIFVLPSYSENFGMSVIEAMLCGIPIVISSGVGICKEVNSSKAGIVTDISVDSVYAGIKILLENEFLRKEYIDKGKKFVEEYYNQEAIARQLVNQYKKILNDE